MEYTRARFREENWAVLDVVRELAEVKDATPAQVSLAWLLEQDVVDAPIVGPRTPEQLDDSLGALSDDDCERIAAPKTPRWPAPEFDWRANRRIRRTRQMDAGSTPDVFMQLTTVTVGDSQRCTVLTQAATNTWLRVFTSEQNRVLRKCTGLTVR